MLVASSQQSTNGVAAGADAAASADQAVPVNLLTVSIPVQYRIRDVEQWGYQSAEPGALLEDLATSAVIRYLVSVNMDELMSYGRLEAGHQLQQRIQALADSARLGVEILFVGLQDIHPPIGTKQVQVASAYEQVIGAMAEKQARIFEAEGNRAEMLPLAAARAMAITNRAQAAATRKTQESAGLAAQFAGQLQANAAAPRVYPQWAYLDALTKAIGPARKLVIGPTNTEDVLILNLEDKLRTDLGDLVVEDPNKKK